MTSNHIHLLVIDRGDQDVIPKSMQLIAGRTGQEYNQRKRHKGGYWEDRYHATAVERGSHLVQCMVYIDMNMVRAGVVKHPSEWKFSGYNEIQNPRQRYAFIDYNLLMELLEIIEVGELISFHNHLIEDSLKNGNNIRAGKWTESIAVGDGEFVAETRARLGILLRTGRAKVKEGSYELHEQRSSYGVDLSTVGESDLRRMELENSYLWNTYSDGEIYY